MVQYGHFFIAKVAVFLTCSSLLAAQEKVPSDPNIVPLVQGHTELAFSLYSTLAPSPSNAVFSPYSISTSLAMLFLGARGSTADEIQSSLRWNSGREQIASASSALAQHLESKQRGAHHQIKLANALWVDEQTYILSEYSHTIETAFRARIDRLNFQETTHSIDTINRWISEQTDGKITDLLQPTDIDAQTCLVVTNAIYFQGNFTSPFDGNLTENRPFYPTPDTSSCVPMMQQVGSFPYLENDLMHMVALPFMNTSTATTALVIVLPRSTDNLPVLERDLSHAMEGWLRSLRPERVSVQIPKFTLKKRLDLNSLLQEMGIKLPFTTQADFSGIDGKLDLYLSKVVHETLFALSESGVVATAATPAAMHTTSTLPDAAPLAFLADHPFLFFIVDMASGELLFMGKFQEPKDVL